MIEQQHLSVSLMTYVTLKALAPIVDRVDVFKQKLALSNSLMSLELSSFK